MLSRVGLMKDAPTKCVIKVVLSCSADEHEFQGFVIDQLFIRPVSSGKTLCVIAVGCKSMGVE